MDPLVHPRLLQWWKDNPSDPDRPSLNNPDVQRLISAISPGAHGTDLVGVMSLNVRLDLTGLVLRVHQPFVSRRRVLAVQEVRRCLAGLGLVVPVPMSWRKAMVFRCGNRWAELEEYVPHERAEPVPGSYRWLFGALGTLQYTAAVPLYSATLAGFTNDPAGLLRARRSFLRLSAWLLTHPEAMIS
jgi:hypothetical protein